MTVITEQRSRIEIGPSTGKAGSERRRPWLLLSPALVTLIALLVLPICVMFAFTFFEFVTAGVEKPVLNLGNWREFFTDTYYHGFLRVCVCESGMALGGWWGAFASMPESSPPPWQVQQRNIRADSMT